MPFYLSEYIGSGTKSDPFRPVGSDQDGWSAIDIRDDPNAPGGQCLLRTPVAFSDARARFLANDKLENLTNPQKNFLTNRLGVDLSSTSLLRDIIALIMNQPPPGRWNPIRPGLLKWEIWLGELIWEAPRISGGAADDFNRADSVLASPWVKIANSGGTLSVVSNMVKKTPAGGADDSAYYYSGSTVTADQYSQLKWATSASIDGGPFVRLTSDPGPSIRGYHLNASLAFIFKVVNGNFTTVATLSNFGSTTSAGDSSRLEVEGSTLRALKVGVGNYTGSPTSDTTITLAGDGAGLFIFDNVQSLDDWSGGDLSSPEPPPAGDAGPTLIRLIGNRQTW